MSFCHIIKATQNFYLFWFIVKFRFVLVPLFSSNVFFTKLSIIMVSFYKNVSQVRVTSVGSLDRKGKEDLFQQWAAAGRATTKASRISSARLGLLRHSSLRVSNYWTQHLRCDSAVVTILMNGNLINYI